MQTCGRHPLSLNIADILCTQCHLHHCLELMEAFKGWLVESMQLTEAQGYQGRHLESLNIAQHWYVVHNTTYVAATNDGGIRVCGNKDASLPSQQPSSSDKSNTVGGPGHFANLLGSY
mmetsp:Transcript_29116/g.56294  ORF Transcript_29116/g.56294 Transcript_29116/m.56294 type:complete len:118 (-) Transcript_29116:288-641(-)